MGAGPLGEAWPVKHIGRDRARGAGDGEKLGTGLARETVSGADGFYRILALPVGAYALGVESAKSGQLSVSRQYSNQLGFNVSYWLSKTDDELSSMNLSGAAGQAAGGRERPRAEPVRRGRGIWSVAVRRAPPVRGERFVGARHACAGPAVVRAIFGGWQINGISTSSRYGVRAAIAALRTTVKLRYSPRDPSPSTTRRGGPTSSCGLAERGASWRARERP